MLIKKILYWSLIVFIPSINLFVKLLYDMHILKGCSYAAGVRDLFINQALPTVCKRNQYFNYKETVIPSSCPAPQY